MLRSRLLIVDECDAIVTRNMRRNIERRSEFYVVGEATLDQFSTRTGLCEHIGKSGRGTLKYRDGQKRLRRFLPGEVAKDRAGSEQIFECGSQRTIRPALPSRTHVKRAP